MTNLAFVTVDTLHDIGWDCDNVNFAVSVIALLGSVVFLTLGVI